MGDGVLVLRVLAVHAQAVVEVLLRKELVAGLAVPALVLVLATLRVREGRNNERRPLGVCSGRVTSSPYGMPYPYMPYPGKSADM